LLGAGPAAALAKLDEIERQFTASTLSSSRSSPARVLLFTGHMIDEPGRAKPRFPAGAENAVREWLRQLVQQEVKAADGPVLGIAGGACGGDILFHEVCAEFAPMTARLYLSVPQEMYVPDRVSGAGGTWVERFYRLCSDRGKPPRVLAGSKELPRWLRDRRDYGPLKRNNAWMLCNALVHGAAKVKLIALWDGDPGDGEDATSHMIQLARSRGIEVLALDARKLCAA